MRPKDTLLAQVIPARGRDAQGVETRRRKAPQQAKVSPLAPKHTRKFVHAFAAGKPARITVVGNGKSKLVLVIDPAGKKQSATGTARR